MSSSEDLFNRAKLLIPGGVNSPVRACNSVGSSPLFIKKGSGSHIFSEEGEEYIDYVMSWGPLILGHSHPEVTREVHNAVDQGSSFGAPCSQEVQLAEMIRQAVPSIERVRIVNSGTEATMSALRVARAYTGKNKVLKFRGCYHGHVDNLLAQAGSGVATLAIPGTPGVPEETVKQTLLAPYNDKDAVESIFEQHGDEIAAIIVEPVAGNMGLVPPRPEFLQKLRETSNKHGSLLIFDEVISGFRVSFGGAQAYYNVTPDLTCLGKIIGGGFPVGAFGGRSEIMDYLAPCGSVYQSGTLAGNPVAMTAGLATLNLLSRSDYQSLANDTLDLAQELTEILGSKGVPIRLNCLGSLFSLFFTSEEVTDFESAQKTDLELFKKFYSQMRKQGIYLPPSNFECIFTSFVHTGQDFEKTLEAARKVEF
ncbi:MAG: glutamate-1-semialdehyde 2,1-aminomutase [Thermodesulfobacteriota bacterium]